MNEIFSKNKELIRDLDLKFIKRVFDSKKEDSLVYFGLPSQEMGDVLLWKDYLKTILAVEYGDFREDNTYIRQHSLMLTAFKNGIANKLILYRGDIDEIILEEKDTRGIILDLPLDLINLDYSSGFIKDETMKRLDAIKKIFRYQKTRFQSEFILFISVNLKHNPAIIGQYFTKAREQAIHTDEELCAKIDLLLNSTTPEVIRLKVFVLSIIKSYSALENYVCAINKPVFYLGNRDTPMLHFSFHLKLSTIPIIPPVNKDELQKNIDKKMLEIIDGKLVETTM